MFEQKKFSIILEKIVELYGSTVAFASFAHVGRSYLSKYINMKIPSPPTPKILEKIANASRGFTTYDELMKICGYIPEDINSDFRSLDMQLAENIFNSYEKILEKYELSQNDLIHIKQVLIKRDSNQSSIENQLNDFSINNSSNSKELFATLIQINDEIEKSLINLHKNGCLYPIPVYKNTKNIDLLLVSDIVDYVNFNVPNSESPSNYFALLINNDKMAPLLDVNDIAIICKNLESENGQIIAAYSITKECCIIGKIFKYNDIIEISYFNGKSDKFMNNDLTILGKVIKAENQSAFK